MEVEVGVKCCLVVVCDYELVDVVDGYLDVVVCLMEVVDCVEGDGGEGKDLVVDVCIGDYEEVFYLVVFWDVGGFLFVYVGCYVVWGDDGVGVVGVGVVCEVGKCLGWVLEGGERGEEEGYGVVGEVS